MDGLNVVDANNVHSRVSRNYYVDKLTGLLPEDLSVAVTEDTASLENSLSSVPGDFGEELPLMLSASEDNDTEEEEEEEKEVTTKKSRRKTNAFKGISKLLSTPMTRRKSVIKTDQLDMSIASLHI